MAQIKKFRIKQFKIKKPVAKLEKVSLSFGKRQILKDLNLKAYQKKVMGSDNKGMNAMSLSDITGIPRPTVVRKLKYLINKK